MEKALAARSPSAAVAHLELARMHRQRRSQAVASRRDLTLQLGLLVYKTDKEG
jgi:hypothetical protein